MPAREELSFLEQVGAALARIQWHREQMGDAALQYALVVAAEVDRLNSSGRHGRTKVAAAMRVSMKSVDKLLARARDHNAAKGRTST